MADIVRYSLFFWLNLVGML